MASWFISPLMAGLMSFILYTVLRMFVLRGQGAYKRAIWCLPILLFITLFVNMFFILYSEFDGPPLWGGGLRGSALRRTAKADLLFHQLTDLSFNSTTATDSNCFRC